MSTFNSEVMKMSLISLRNEMNSRIDNLIKMISGDDNISISLKPTVKKVVKKRTNKTLDDDCQCCAYLYKYQKGGARAKRCSREKNGSGDFCIMHKKTMVEKYNN